MNNLAQSYFSAGTLHRALSQFEDLFKTMKGETRPRPSPHFTKHEQFGNGLRVGGEVRARPRRSLQESLKKRKAKLGLDHPDTLRSMMNLAMA